MGAGFGFLQLENNPPGDDLAAVIDEVTDDLLESQYLRAVADNGQHDYAERGLHRRMFVKLIQEYLGILVLLQFDDDPHAVAVGFITQIGDTFDLLFAHQLSDLLDQSRLVYLVRYFRNDD